SPARSSVQYGPARKRVRSRTATPASGFTRLPALEHGLALLEEGADRLGAVLAAGVHALGQALGLERLVHAPGERAPDEALGQRRGRAAGEATGPTGDEGVELARRHHAVHETELGGLLRRDDVGEERQLLRAVHADQPRQEPRAAEVDAEPAPGKDLREPRAL